MSNYPTAGGPSAAPTAAYHNTAMEVESESNKPSGMHMEPPPPYSGPGPESQMPYPGPPYNGGVPYNSPYPGPPSNGGGPYPPYPAGPMVTNVIMPNATGPRYACAHCQGQFVYHRHRGIARCPFCHRMSAVGNYIRARAITYMVIGAIFLFLGIGITVLFALLETGYFFFWIGGILIGIIFLVRGGMMLATFKTATPITGPSVTVSA